MSKFTKGPWETWGDSEIILYVREGRANGATLCTMQLPHSIDDVAEQNANAHLIAAAPDLYEACKQINEYWTAGKARSRGTFKLLRKQLSAALAKAKPQS